MTTIHNTTRFTLTFSLCVAILSFGCNPVGPGDRPVVQERPQNAVQSPSTNTARNHERVKSPIAGDWLRMDDQNAGAIVRFEETPDGLVGTLVYPGNGLARFGFKTGQIKIRDLIPLEAGEWKCRSRVQTGDGWGGFDGHWYDDTTLELMQNQFFLRGADALKSQRWTRVSGQGQSHAHLLYGLCELHRQRSDYPGLAQIAKALVEKRSHLNSEQLNTLAWELATFPEPKARHPKIALQLAEEACLIDGFNAANYLDTLAAAYAANAVWDRAVEYQTHACQDGFIEGAGKRLELYRRKVKYHQGLDLPEITFP